MDKTEKSNSALQVNSGIDQPESINKNVVNIIKKRRKVLPISEYVEGIKNGNLTMLSRAITLVESTNPSHYMLAQEIIEKSLPLTGRSIRIGITGVPGVGKSTFIETLGNQIVDKPGNKLAVLAVDPSSEQTKGSILGDKTRMEKLAGHPQVFVRPSPSAGSLGGVARKTREVIMLCEAAGFNTIFVETVGVGQSETMVHSMVDFFLLLLLAGAGDELQGIKRGIMEMADMIAITKCDGSNKAKAQIARQECENALHLFPPPKSGFQTRVHCCSSKTGDGIDNIWESVLSYMQFCKNNGYFESRRKEQSKFWMYETIHENLRNGFYQNPEVNSMLHGTEKDVLEGKQSSYLAAKRLLDQYFGNLT